MILSQNGAILPDMTRLLHEDCSSTESPYLLAKSVTPTEMLLIAALIPMAMLAKWDSIAPRKHPTHPEMTKAAPISAIQPDPDRERFLAATLGPGRQYLLNGGFEDWTRNNTRTRLVAGYYESLLEVWRSHVPDIPGYEWAETHGAGTQIIEVVLKWEEKSQHNRYAWNQRQRTLYFTSTPTFDFGSSRYAYRDTIRVVRGAKNEALAQLFVEATGFQPGVAQSLSLNCRAGKKIRSMLFSDNFFEERAGALGRGSEIGTQFTTIATVLLNQLLTFGSTDFVLAYESGTNFTRHTSLEMDELHRSIPGHRFQGRRNLFATAKITGIGSTLAVPMTDMMVVSAGQ